METASNCGLPYFESVRQIRLGGLARDRYSPTRPRTQDGTGDRHQVMRRFVLYVVPFCLGAAAFLAIFSARRTPPQECGYELEGEHRLLDSAGEEFTVAPAAFTVEASGEKTVAAGDDECPGATPADRLSDNDLALAAPTWKPFVPEALDYPEPRELPKNVESTPISPIEISPIEIDAGDPAEEAVVPPTEKKPAPAPAKIAMTPQLLRLRYEIREALAWHFEHPQRTTERSPWGAMHAMLPYGVDGRIIDHNGRLQNTVGYLCFNNSCKGQRIYHLKNGKIAAHIGPGFQGHHGQFLAMLAQSKVSVNYPVRIEGKNFTVRDIIDYEKETCEAGSELTFKLIGIAHYEKHDVRWKNRKGEDWDIPRLIREELAQPVVGAACGGTHRMMGFSYAARKHAARNEPMTGQWLRAEKFVDSYHDYAFSLQNRDGSFSTNWFASRGDAPEPQRKMQTTGHITEWLVYSLSDEQMTDPRLLRSIAYIAVNLNRSRDVKWEVGPLGHALHALALYDERVFGGIPGKRAEQLAKENRHIDTKKLR